MDTTETIYITNPTDINDSTIGITSIGATGATGSSLWGVNGISDYTFASPNNVWTTNSTWGNLTIGPSMAPSTIGQSGTMELYGEDADIKINGRSLMDAIAALEQRLNILVPNPELEAEWDQLRELGERYRELEKQCKEKGEMWKKLKSLPPQE